MWARMQIPAFPSCLCEMALQMRWTSPAWLCSKVQCGRVLRPMDGTGVRVWTGGACMVQMLQSRRALPPWPHLLALAVGQQRSPRSLEGSPGAAWQEQPPRNQASLALVGDPAVRSGCYHLECRGGGRRAGRVHCLVTGLSGESSAASLLCESRGHYSVVQPRGSPLGRRVP